MRLDTPNQRQSEFDRQRTLNPRQSSEEIEQAAARHHKTTITGTVVVLVAIALALAIFFIAFLPSGVPNSGSSSTSAEVDPAATVQPKHTPAPGINPDGR
jgi:hypothetical protein